MRIVVANDNDEDPHLYVVCGDCGCGTYHVRHVNGLDWIVCSNCGEDMTEQVFRNFAGHNA